MTNQLITKKSEKCVPRLMRSGFSVPVFRVFCSSVPGSGFFVPAFQVPGFLFQRSGFSVSAFHFPGFLFRHSRFSVPAFYVPALPRSEFSVLAFRVPAFYVRSVSATSYVKRKLGWGCIFCNDEVDIKRN